MEPYLESVDAIRLCPDDPKGAEHLLDKGTSYVTNSYLSRTGLEFIWESNPNGSTTTTTRRREAYRKLTTLKASSKTITFFESADRNVKNYAATDLWFRLERVQSDTVLDAVQRDVQTNRHDGAAHYLYADGHVDSIDEAQIADWCRDGVNFGRPPQ